MRKTRKEIGDKTKIPLYGILSNEQLALMAQNPPKTKEDFLKIKGVNEQKYKQFGEIFLSAIQKALLTTEEAEKVVPPRLILQNRLLPAVQKFRRVMLLQSVSFRDYSAAKKLPSLLRSVTTLVRAVYPLLSVNLQTA